MRKINLILVLALVGILLAPGVAVAKMADACCGVDVADLQVSDAPDPACEGGTVTISGTYVTFSPWGEWTLPYDTGILIKIYDSSMALVDEYAVSYSSEEDPGDYPGTEWAFSYDWTAGTADTYTYEVFAWSDGGYGRMEISVVGETIDVEVCMEIDIKPGSDPNSINPKGKGVIPVAILTTDTFDAATVDPGTVTFGPTGTEASPDKWAMEDVDDDGDIDMILHFKSQECGFSAGDETGTVICNQGSASDSVNIVPKGK